MEVKDYLKQIRKLDVDIKANEDIIEKLKSEEYRCTSMISDMPRGTGVKDVNSITDARIDLESTVREYKLKHLIMRNNAVKMIESLENPSMRAILKQYYINGLTWEQTAVVVRFSWRQMHRLHNKAVDLMVLKFDNN